MLTFRAVWRAPSLEKRVTGDRPAPPISNDIRQNRGIPVVVKILSCLLWTPLLGALVLGFMPQRLHRHARGVAAGFSGLSLAWTLALAIRFDTASPN